MKNRLLFIVFFFNCPSYAQQIEWAFQTDGLSGEQGKKVCIDGKGN